MSEEPLHMAKVFISWNNLIRILNLPAKTHIRHLSTVDSVNGVELVIEGDCMPEVKEGDALPRLQMWAGLTSSGGIILDWSNCPYFNKPSSTCKLSSDPNLDKDADSVNPNGPIPEWCELEKGED